MKKIIKDLAEQIDDAKNNNEDLEEASWNYQKGVILSVNDAIKIVTKLTEATSEGNKELMKK